MTIAFTKMQGAGNDFLVLEGEVPDWPALAPDLCSRHFGVGGDGLLVLLPSAVADVRMRMYNPDGTEDHCGNGLRCLALYAWRKGHLSEPEFRVETLAGIKQVRVHDTGNAEVQVTADMGVARLAPAEVPMLLDGPTALGVTIQVAGTPLTVHPLSTGTTHTVIFEDVSDERFQLLSPALENHPLFPERTSVLWARPVSETEVTVRIWERGAGETLACGTGACAVAVAAHLAGHTGPKVAVRSRGGTLHVEVADDLSTRITGPAAFVFAGAWSL